MKVFPKFALAALVAVAPLAASAAVVFQISATGSSIAPVAATPVNTTLVAPETYLENVLAFGTESFEYNFTADGPMTVNGVSFTANGTSVDVGRVSLSFDGGPLVAFTPEGNPASSTGEFNFPAFDLADGEMFSFTLDYDGVVAPVFTNAFFQTTPIPVPAALPLLLGGIAALGVVSRKKKKS